MKILHAEKSPVVRLGTKHSLLAIDENLVFSEADSYSKMLKQLQANEYDLIILDGLIPGGESFKMVSTIKAIQPRIAILLFCNLDESTFGMHYLMAGAEGFISKSVAIDELLSAVSTLLAGKKYITERTRTGFLNSTFGTLIGNENPFQGLSATQLMIAEMVSKGRMVKEIAIVLQLAQSTVSFHKAQLYQRMGVQTSVELNQVMKRFAACRDGSGSGVIQRL